MNLLEFSSSSRRRKSCVAVPFRIQVIAVKPVAVISKTRASGGSSAMWRGVTRCTEELPREKEREREICSSYIPVHVSCLQSVLHNGLRHICSQDLWIAKTSNSIQLQFQHTAWAASNIPRLVITYNYTIQISRQSSVGEHFHDCSLTTIRKCDHLHQTSIHCKLQFFCIG